MAQLYNTYTLPLWLICKRLFAPWFLTLLLSVPYVKATEKPTSPTEAVNSITQKSQIITGDLDKMEERRVVRFLVPYSKTFFFLDTGTPRGLTYDWIKSFEQSLNEKLKDKDVQIHAVIIPTARQDLIPKLIEGKGDVATGYLTITDERLLDADFTDPFLKNVHEHLVTHRLSQKYHSIFDLTGSKIHIRLSSSYKASLDKVNLILADFELEPITIIPVDEMLEDEDILEMVNANFIGRTIIDQHVADFWAQIFPDIVVQHDIEVNTEGEIAWAIRKNSPLLRKELNDFVAVNREGTLSGNILLKKYLQTAHYITDSLHAENKERYNRLIKTFEKYGRRYKYDHFLLVALAYQESQLNQDAAGIYGAVGVMQILPSTAGDKNINVPDISSVDGNIHAGTKYLRFLADRYFPKSENITELNRALFSIAAYNAGPNKITQLRQEAREEGYDPNIWFHNVEIIAAQRIEGKTVQYVSNIFKYYIAYSQLNVNET